MKMREMFKGYTRYTEEEYKKIWQNSLIVVDTNILLNLFRYSKDTKEEVLNILNNLKSRLWIPYQVAYEFFSNKDKVILTANDDYEKLNKSLSEYKCNVINEINNIKNSRLKCKNELIKVIEDTSNKLNNIIEVEKSKKVKDIDNYKLEDTIIDLFNDVTGKKLNEKEYLSVVEEGQRRIINRIPPGYKDSQKDENSDYIIFYSIIKKAKEEKRDVIFITDDVKEDWFTNIKGIKSARKEILDEFYKETKQLLLIYTADSFIKSYNDNFKKSKVKESVITEIKTIQREANFSDKTDVLNDIEKIRIMLFDNEQNISKSQAQEVLYMLKNIVKNSIPKYKQAEVLMYEGILEECLLEERRDLFVKNAKILIEKILQCVLDFNGYNNKIDDLYYEYNNLIHKLNRELSPKSYARLHLKFRKLMSESNEYILRMGNVEPTNFKVVDDLFKELIHDETRNKNEVINIIKKELKKNLDLIKEYSNYYF